MTSNYWFSLLKNVVACASSSFDVTMDVIAGVGFIKGTKNHTSTLNTSVTTNSTGDVPVTYILLNSSANSTNTQEITNHHLVWGYLTIALIFLPGIFVVLSPDTVERYWNCKKEYVLFRLLFTFVCLCYPLLLAIIQIIALCSPTDHTSNRNLIHLVAYEAFFESAPQLMLQLFTLFYKYEGSWVQAITIIGSAFLLGKTVIEFDATFHNVELKGFMGTVKYTLSVLPLYVSSILFRIVSITITLAYLRFWSLLPMLTLLLELIVTSGVCIQWNPTVIYAMVLSNLSTMNVGMVYDLDKDYLANHPLPVDINRRLKTFVKVSTVVTYLHHTICLVIIIVLVIYYPTKMAHWNSDLVNFLQPNDSNFRLLFAMIFLTGLMNLLLVLYTTRDIKLHVEPSQTEINVEEIPMQENRYEKFVEMKRRNSV